VSRAVTPYGAWTSPLSAAAAASGAARFGGLGLTHDSSGRPTVWWAESRPDEDGRIALVAASGSDERRDEGPDGLRLRSRVGEYGGGAFWAAAHHVAWVDEATQQVCMWHSDAPAPAPITVTPPPPTPRSWRHTAGRTARGGTWVLVEREAHTDDAGRPLAEARNELVALCPADRTAWVLVGPDDVGGGDFVAAPTPSPDGRSLAWLRWDHPDMPWDAAELWVGELDLEAVVPTLVRRRRVAGGRVGGAAHGLQRAVSVCLPEWSPDGRLWWCDDADGWWHLRVAPTQGAPGEGAGDDPATAVPGGGAPGEEVGEPRWVAGGRRYGFLDDGRVVMAVASDGLDRLELLDPVSGERSAVPGPAFSSIEWVVAEGADVAVIAGLATRPTSVWRLDVATGDAVDLRPVPSPVPEASISVPTSITFPTGPPRAATSAASPEAHTLFYAPCNAEHVGPEGELPPLVVRIHGGPTAAARSELSTSVQFWTTRGFAVADVNYRGSTGYGRDYRDQLLGAWGVADVEDCLAVTRALAAQGLVDGARCVIRGGSAGGFTALAAVCFQSSWGADGAFAAACSLYGVTDLASLAADTHKFESRYLDGLVAPLPEGADVYRSRSPLHHARQLDRPVLMLQGSDDKVVPPAQAEVLVAALEANGVPHRYLRFEGEGHGFRKASTIVAALEAELAFYGEVLGFEPAG
jgi:dipeptidyl aminopeptidase/acylaminoacyl peptidase